MLERNLDRIGGQALSADEYLAGMLSLVARLGDDREVHANILRAGETVASSLAAERKVWIARTSHCLHDEATYRAGGLIAAHILENIAVVQPGDCVIEGTPVGTSNLAIDTALGSKIRGATLIALTNVEFENDPRTIVEHPSERRLHEIADIVVDLGGPIGDGMFAVGDPPIRVIPHSGVTGMVAMWMIFAEATSVLRGRNKLPRFYECIMISGADVHNATEIDAYLRTNRGFDDLVAASVSTTDGTSREGEQEVVS
jgi:uncharacterized phosphosugar-binding protein